MKDDFVILETIETWIVYAWHSEGEWERQNIEVSFHRKVVVSRTAMHLGFSRSTISSVYQERATTQRTSSQFDTTVGSIEVNMGPASLWNALDTL